MVSGARSQAVADPAALADVIHRFMRSVDMRDADAMAKTLTETIAFDYSALGAQMPADRDTFVREVPAGMAEQFRSTQHFLSGLVFEDPGGPEPRCLCNYRATHWMPDDPNGDFWELAGRYAFGLRNLGPADDADWRIHSLKLDVSWSRGNARLTRNAIEHSGL